MKKFCIIIAGVFLISMYGCSRVEDIPVKEEDSETGNETDNEGENKPTPEDKETVEGLVKFPKIEALKLSEDYNIKVGDNTIDCYATYRFNEKSSKKILGRPVSNLNFAMFDFIKNADVVLTLKEGLIKDPNKIRILPSKLGIKPKVDGNKIEFRLEKPENITVAIDDIGLDALHLFTNYPETSIPNINDPNVIYYGPGVHDVESITLLTGQTLYLAPGAFLRVSPKGTGQFTDANNIKFETARPAITLSSDTKLLGRGIISGSLSYTNKKRFNIINVSDASNVEVKDILVMDGCKWVCNTFKADKCTFDNVKVLSFFNNSDGICVSSSQNCIVKNCFVHNADDALEIKSWAAASTDNILFQDCQVWSDVGTAMGLTGEILCDVSNAEWRDISVLFHTSPRTPNYPETRGTITLACLAGGKVSNIKFVNIDVENITDKKPLINLYNTKVSWAGGPIYTDKPYSSINDISFINIKAKMLYPSWPKAIVFADSSPNHNIVSDIKMENIYLNDMKLSNDNYSNNIKNTGNVKFIIK